MTNVARELWKTARVAQRQTAIVERERSVSYGELHTAAAAVAAALTAAGVMPDEPVAILLERGADAAAAFFGVLASGAIAVVVHEALRPRQIEYVLEHAGAGTLISSADLLGRLARPLVFRDAVRIIDMHSLEAPAQVLEPVPRRRDDPAQIVYTSGSTGQPKGVALSHGNLRAALETVTAYLGLEPSDRIASLLPFGFVYGMSQLLCTVHVGATLVVERAPLPQDVARTVRAQRISVLAAVPPQWIGLLSTATFQEPLPALRVMTNAGGHLPVAVVRRLRRAQPEARLYLMYGLTEALRTTYLDPDEV
ncbi:MAG TPA: AMP-binding protein, partial [Gemmatimonadales bacterium]|nr:AMP-binding protein [Gemmatimonadales bacterium]